MSMLCLGLIWCQDEAYNKAECLFELITGTRQLGDDLELEKNPATVIMFSERINDETCENVILQTEQWEMTLLTLFEIATLTIPNHVGL